MRLIRYGLDIPAVDYIEAVRERPRLQGAAEIAMEGIDALILPATAIVAPPVDAGPEVREPLSRFTRPFNTTYQPVAVIPAPVQGLPAVGQQVGRQVVEEQVDGEAALGDRDATPVADFRFEVPTGALSAGSTCSSTWAVRS